MNRQEECQELLMQDVVRIDIMPIAAIKVSVPYNIENVSAAVVTMADGAALTDAKLFAASLLSLNLTVDELADAEMQEGLTHKVSQKRDSAGMVRTHTLQVPIESGFQAVRDKDNVLQETDFCVLLKAVDGTRYLAYEVPNTCQASIDDQMGQTAKMTLKVSLKSMSGFIRIEQ